MSSTPENNLFQIDAAAVFRQKQNHLLQAFLPGQEVAFLIMSSHERLQLFRERTRTTGHQLFMLEDWFTEVENHGKQNLIHKHHIAWVGELPPPQPHGTIKTLKKSDHPLPFSELLLFFPKAVIFDREGMFVDARDMSGCYWGDAEKGITSDMVLNPKEDQ